MASCEHDEITDALGVYAGGDELDVSPDQPFGDELTEPAPDASDLEDELGL